MGKRGEGMLVGMGSHFLLYGHGLAGWRLEFPSLRVLAKKTQSPQRCALQHSERG